MNPYYPSRDAIISVCFMASGTENNEKNVNQRHSRRRASSRTCRWAKTL